MKEKSLWMSIIRVNKVHLDYICFAFFLILSISSDICLISGPLLRRQYQVFLEKKKSNGFWDWFAHAYVYLVSTFYTHKAPCMHVCICEGHVGVLMEQIYVGRQMQSKICAEGNSPMIATTSASKCFLDSRSSPACKVPVKLLFLSQTDYNCNKVNWWLRQWYYIIIVLRN